MKLRSFTSHSMQSAMEMVRETLGENAIILNNSTDKSGKVTLTAAVEEVDAPLPAASPAPSAAILRGIAMRGDEEWLDELVSLLRYHGTPETLAGRILYRARHMELEKLFSLQKLGAASSHKVLEQKALIRLMEAFFNFTPLQFRTPQHLLLMGPPGIGKTLCIAKLAAQLTMDKMPVSVVTTDIKRAGGIEQLSAFTDILELSLQIAKSPSELKTLILSTPPQNHVLVDTAGANPYDAEEMEELMALVSASGCEPLLALPSGIDACEAGDISRAYAHIDLSRMLVTRADTTRRFGSILASADAASLSFANASTSARVVGELQEMTATLLAQWLLKYKDER